VRCIRARGRYQGSVVRRYLAQFPTHSHGRYACDREAPGSRRARPRSQTRAGIMPRSTQLCRMPWSQPRLGPAPDLAVPLRRKLLNSPEWTSPTAVVIGRADAPLARFPSGRYVRRGHDRRVVGLQCAWRETRSPGLRSDRLCRAARCPSGSSHHLTPKLRSSIPAGAAVTGASDYGRAAQHRGQPRTSCAARADRRALGLRPVGLREPFREPSAAYTERHRATRRDNPSSSMPSRGMPGHVPRRFAGAF
jgi:hypothetical protein